MGYLYVWANEVSFFFLNFFAFFLFFVVIVESFETIIVL